MSQALSEENMTLEQKIGQTMIIGFDGTTVDDDLRRVITEQAGVECAGVQAHVTAREAFRPVETTLHLLAIARRRSGDA